jgi:hypothetical protein
VSLPLLDWVENRPSPEFGDALGDLVLVTGGSRQGEPDQLAELPMHFDPVLNLPESVR